MENKAVQTFARFVREIGRSLFRRLFLRPIQGAQKGISRIFVRENAALFMIGIMASGIVFIAWQVSMYIPSQMRDLKTSIYANQNADCLEDSLLKKIRDLRNHPYFPF